VSFTALIVFVTCYKEEIYILSEVRIHIFHSKWCILSKLYESLFGRYLEKKPIQRSYNYTFHKNRKFYVGFELNPVLYGVLVVNG
jgi:hypothetical protein